MDKLVQQLKQEGVLQTPALVRAFQETDRKDFVPPDFQESAYGDYPLPLAGGQTISQPYTVAFMLELLQPQKGDKILDVGAGSAWTTALLAYVVGPKGKVYGTELVPELVELGKENLKKYNLPQAQIVQAPYHFSNGTGQAKKGVLGLPDKAPFDRILVSAAAREIPQELVKQLSSEGVMVLPVQSAVVRVRMIPGREPAVQRFEGFGFVPLV